MSLHLAVPSMRGSGDTRPEPDPAQFEAWLAHVRTLDAMASVAALTEFLTPFNRRRVRAALRQQVAEALFDAARPALEELNAQLTDIRLPPDDTARAQAQAADTLLTELAYAWKLQLTEQSHRLFGLASSGRAQLPVVRAMELLAQRLLLAWRLHAPAPRTVWLDLHTLHQFALRRGFAQRGTPAGSPSPADVYREALLIAFAEPHTFMVGELQPVLALVRQWGGRALLSPPSGASGGTGLFHVRPQHDAPGLRLGRRTQGALPQQGYILDARPVRDALAALSARDRQPEIPTAAAMPSDGTPALAGLDTPGRLDLLRRLVACWGGSATRRHERAASKKLAALYPGIDGVWDFLATAPDASRTASRWRIVNASASGLALVLDEGQIDAVRVGDVVGLHERPGTACRICVVRRIRCDVEQPPELALEEIAPAAKPGFIHATHGDSHRDPEPVLVLPGISRSGATPALLARQLPLNITCELNLRELQTHIRVKATQLLECTTHVQVLRFNAMT